MTSLIGQLRDEHPGRTLLLDAGDTFQDTYVSNSTAGELVGAMLDVDLDGQEASLEGSSPAYGDVEVWVVAQHIRDHSPVHPKVEGRIVQR